MDSQSFGSASASSMSIDYDFEIYRPEQCTGRLEKKYAPRKQDDVTWRPSLSYKYSLEDIKHQLTPAEYFRYQLATSGKEIRSLQRLETRIHNHREIFDNAALKIEKVYRGMKGRQAFGQVKEELTKALRLRESTAAAEAAFRTSDYNGAVRAVDGAWKKTIRLLEIKMKALYRMQKFQECTQTAKQLVAIDERSETGYYVQSCAFVRMGDIPAAYRTMKLLSMMIESPGDDSFRLNGFICAKIQAGDELSLSPAARYGAEHEQHAKEEEEEEDKEKHKGQRGQGDGKDREQEAVIGPLHQEAVDGYTVLIDKDPADYSALLFRASSYSCLQDWQAALKDVDFILLFQPEHVEARLLRARIYACTRRWREAQEDYELVLNYYDPDSAVAARGMDDICQKSVDLPMMRDDIGDFNQD